MNTDNNGLIQVKSTHSIEATAERLENTITEKGLTLIARVNHAAAAEKVGEALRPTELFLFGNPKSGTPLMQSKQTMGIDLPQKILLWQDADDTVWLSYNDPDYMAQRHSVEDCEVLIDNTSKALAGIVQQVC